MDQLSSIDMIGMSVEDFKKNYWGKQTLHVKKALAKPAGFFSKYDFERELSNPMSSWDWNTHNPHAKHIDSNEDDESGEPDKIFGLKNQQAKALRAMGMYIFVNDVQNGNSSIFNFIMSIQNALASPSSSFESMMFQSNRLGGHFMHNDTVEGFIIQLEGTRKWLIDTQPAKIRRKVHLTKDNKFLISGGIDNDLVISKEDMIHDLQEINLEAGDFLYMPAYTVHATYKSDLYSLSLNIFRRWKSALETISDCINFNDLDMAEELNAALAIGRTSGDIKSQLVNKIKVVYEYLQSRDEDYFATIAKQFSLAEFKNKNLPESLTGDQNFNNLSIHDEICRLPMLCAKVVETKHGCNLYIDGREIEFEDKKWLYFLLLLESGKPFGGMEALEVCGLDKDENWGELSEYLSTLGALGILSVKKFSVNQRNKKAS